MNLRTEIKKLDRVFSKYIRLRDRIDGGDFAYCCTCGRPKPLKEMDAGHFINRRHYGTRFDERNVHSQCRKCNRFEEGKLYEYGLFLKEKYGDDIIDRLNVAKKVNKLDIFKVQAMLMCYKAKVKDMI